MVAVAGIESSVNPLCLQWFLGVQEWGLFRFVGKEEIWVWRSSVSMRVRSYHLLFQFCTELGFFSCG
jgi:hypothetical protein